MPSDPLAAVLPPDLSTTFLVTVILPLAIGFVIGLLMKQVAKVGIVVAALILLLIIAGFISPEQVLKPIIGFLKSGSEAKEWVNRVAGYLPYASVTFIVGLIVGFLMD